MNQPKPRQTAQGPSSAYVFWRDYEPKPMNEIPYRRPEGDARAERVAGLVREIAVNRRALLSHRAVVRDLGRIVKDPWKDGPVEIDRAALVRELPPEETVSVRLDPALGLELLSTPVGKAVRESLDALAFRYKRELAARVRGGEARLALLSALLGAGAVEDLPGALLPRDLEAFEARVRERAELVAGLLTEGRRLVEEVERLVCALFEVPDDLTDEVVAHAVARATRAGSPAA